MRDSLVSMVGKQRKHFRTQYDGDESRQRVARRNRRQAVGKKGREKQEVKLMQGAQYMVMDGEGDDEGGAGEGAEAEGAEE